MLKRISDRVKRVVERLYAKGLSAVEIAMKSDVPYAAVHRYIKLRQKGFKSYSEYRGDLARQRGFKSLNEYEEYAARQKGFKSRTAYSRSLVKKRGFNSLNDYQEYLIIKRGFGSKSEYEEHLAKKRQQKAINQRLSDLIKRRLNKLGKTQRWLAKQLEITDSTISRYMQGRFIPQKSSQRRLFKMLKLPYKTLDDLVEDVKNPRTKVQGVLGFLSTSKIRTQN